jgi:hypothetical protein
MLLGSRTSVASGPVRSCDRLLVVVLAAGLTIHVSAKAGELIASGESG